MINAPELVLTLCQREESILLNDDILDILGRPQQVHLMINEEQCRLLLQACTTTDRGAVVVPNDKIVQFPISGRSLLRHVRKLMLPRLFHITIFSLCEMIGSLLLRANTAQSAPISTKSRRIIRLSSLLQFTPKDR